MENKIKIEVTSDNVLAIVKNLAKGQYTVVTGDRGMAAIFNELQVKYSTKNGETKELTHYTGSYRFEYCTSKGAILVNLLINPALNDCNSAPHPNGGFVNSYKCYILKID